MKQLDVVYSIEDGCFNIIAQGEYGAEDNSNIVFDKDGYPISDLETVINDY